MLLHYCVEVDAEPSKDCDHKLAKHGFSSVAADAELEWDVEPARTNRRYDYCVATKLPSLKVE